MADGEDRFWRGQARGEVPLNGMTKRYKVVGVDVGDTALRLDNCLTMHRSHGAVNTPAMYARTRGSAIGWMSHAGAIQDFAFFEELFRSDAVLDHEVPERGQQGDTAAILVAALLIAFPDGRFGFGLSGGEDSLTTQHYRSLGKHSLALRDRSEARESLARLFDYLRNNSYWVDDDLVHVLALLSALCRDRNPTTPEQVLSLSTTGNHQVDAGLFHAYQLVEALLERRDHESLRTALDRWNRSRSHQLDANEIAFIKNLRDISLHFKAPTAEKQLKDSQASLGFDQDPSRQQEFLRYGIQKLLREAARVYCLDRMK